MVSKFLKILTLSLSTFFVPVIVLADGVPETGKSNKEFGEAASTANKVASGVDATSKKGSAAEVPKKLPAYSLQDQDLLKYQYCGKDSDCMQVVNGCCQCMQGDPITSINKKHISEFERRFNCENVKCPLDSETHRCMDGVVSCIKFRCTYFPPE